MPSIDEYSKTLRNAGKLKEAEEYYIAGVRLQKAGKIDEAISEFEKAIESASGHQQAHELRAVASFHVFVELPNQKLHKAQRLDTEIGL